MCGYMVIRNSFRLNNIRKFIGIYSIIISGRIQKIRQTSSDRSLIIMNM